MLFRFLLALAAALSCAPVVPAQLIAYFPFAGNAVDATNHGFSANTVNATYTASGGYTGAGAQGGAYLFNGTSNYLEMTGLNINPSVYPRLTIGAWVRASSNTPIRQIVSQDNGGFDRSLGIDDRGSTTGWSAGIGSGGALGGESVATDTWTFVAVVYDQPAQTATLYVDDRAYTATNAVLGTGWNLTRVGMNPSSGQYFAGTIDELFFYNGALTASQLADVRLHGVSSIPEPSTFAFLGLGLGLVALAVRRRRE